MNTQSQVPPHDSDIEQAILGAMLIERDALNETLEILRNPDYFYIPKNATIFKAITKLFNNGEAIDLLTITQYLRSKGELEKVGGSSYISELTTRVNSAAHISKHCRLLMEDYLRRESFKKAQSMMQKAFDKENDVFDMLDDAESSFFMLRGQITSTSYSNMFDASKKYMQELQDRISLASKGELQGVPSGILSLDRVTGGWRMPDLIIIAARPAMGKALKMNELILSENGWIKNKDIEIGTKVAGSDGKFYNVTGVFPQGKRQAYKVTFDDGTCVECDEEHLWSTRSRSERKYNKPASTKTLREIIDSGIFVNNTNRKNHSIQFCRPIEFEEKDLIIHPYLLGALLGDGGLTGSTIKFSNPEVDIIDRVSDLLPVQNEFILGNDGLNHSICLKNIKEKKHCLKNKLEELRLTGKLSNQKFIPESYKFASVDQRIKLLQGLVDTDGYVVEQKANGWKGNVIEYSTVSEQLADDVAELARSLGGRVSVKNRMGKYKLNDKYTETQTNYRLYMSFPEDITPFQSWKHARRYTNKKGFHSKFIVSVEKTNIEEMQCISVDAPDSLYITKDYIVTHNTALILTVLRNAAVQFNKPVAIFSLEMSTSQLVERLISAETQTLHSKMKKGDLSEDDMRNIVQKSSKLVESNIFIDDTAGISLMELKAKARKLKKTENIQLIAIDYLQLMRGSREKNGNREQEVSAISRGLKEMAKELEIPVIALSQLSRAVETRGGDKRPMLSDLRESGSIEQDADMVAFIYRPEYYGITEDENGESVAGIGEFIIAKHRSGNVETVGMKFIGKYMQYKDVNDYDNVNGGEPIGQMVESYETKQLPSGLNDFENERVIADEGSPF